MDRKAAWIVVWSIPLIFLVMAGLIALSAPVQAQDAPTPTPHATSTPLYSALLEVYGDRPPRLATLTPTPFPTWTPTPSDTPRPTATPVPTDTPAPPPTATPTPVIEPTATPEDVRTPSPTPVPTNTPTPSPTPLPRCWGTVTATRLNVRDVPWGTVLGQVTLGQTLFFDARWFQDFWWWRIEFWDATGDDTFIGAYVSADWIALGDTADCSQVTDVTPVTIKQGGHIISAQGANTLMAHCAELSTVKLFELVMSYADDFRACNPDIWIVCRFWTDDIAHDTHYDALASYERIGDKFPADCNAVEWENEHTPTTQRDWERWSQYSIEAATLMADRRNMQYCAFSFGPGWPAFDDLKYIIEYLRWVADNPLPDGRYHCVASHAAMYAPWSRADMEWVNNPYLSGRVYLMRDWIYVITPDNFDLNEWPGVWSITEVGLSDGYSGNWSAPYSCGELAAAFWETHRVYGEHGYPGAFQQWNYGVGGIWHDDSPCAGVVWG